MKTTKLNPMPRMRFTETDTQEQETNPDTTVSDVKFPDDGNSFLSVINKY
jgi:hypothetical protein